jgi:archaeal arginyl aminopeptidase
MVGFNYARMSAGKKLSKIRRPDVKVLMISADNFEDSELLFPYYRLREEGIDVDIASMSKGKIKGKHGYEVEANKSLDEVRPGEYDMLILPGGKAPAAVRKEKKALDITKYFFEKNKPVSAICHGPQILISAGLMKGRRATSYKSVAPELKEAEALYEDKEVVIDGNLVTSRQPSDLPAFMRETMKKLKEKQKL